MGGMKTERKEQPPPPPPPPLGGLQLRGPKINPRNGFFKKPGSRGGGKEKGRKGRARRMGLEGRG